MRNFTEVSFIKNKKIKTKYNYLLYLYPLVCTIITGNIVISIKKFPTKKRKNLREVKL